MRPKWMDKKESHRGKSDKRVKVVAKATGGHVVANSGATPFSKGDISYPNDLLEHKMTGKNSFKLDKEMLSKHYKDSVKAGKEPIVMIEFKDYYLIGKVFKK